MITASVELLKNAAATGAGFAWPGGRGVFSAAGTIGGATISLQFLGPDGSTWIDAGAGTTLLAAGAGVFELPPCQIRAAVTGGAPAALYAQAARVPQ